MLKNGKIFKIFNIVDVAVFLIILMIAAGFWFRSYGKVDKTISQSSEFFAEVFVHDIRKSNVEGLKKSVGLGFITDDKTPSEFGTLIKVEDYPANGIIPKDDGTYVNAEKPERYDVKLTFKFDGRLSESGYYNSALLPISADTYYVIKSKWSSVYAVGLRVWQE